MAWITYTVQSWTALWIRHVLCTLAPVSSTAAKWAEYIRFPVACSATCTFVVWNTILFPYVYFVGLKNDERQKQFYEFASSYGVMQRHVFNILYAVLNILWASPPRPVEWVDLALAYISLSTYMVWYTFILDRVGIHIYPMLTPRVWWVTLGMWSFVVFLYYCVFLVWKSFSVHEDMWNWMVYLRLDGQAQAER